MATENKVVARKATGNKNTEILVGSAAAKLAAGITNLQSVIETVSKIGEIAGNHTLKVVELEDQIGGLKQEFENQKAQNKLELELQYKSDEKEFAEDYAKTAGLVFVVEKEYNKTKQELQDLNTNMETKIAQEVGKAKGMLEASHKSEMRVKDLELATKEAQTQAEVTQLKEQNTFLKGQVEHWMKALEEERKAGIERAKAASINTLNVGGTTQGR